MLCMHPLTYEAGVGKVPGVLMLVFLLVWVWVLNVGVSCSKGREKVCTKQNILSVRFTSKSMSPFTSSPLVAALHQCLRHSSSQHLSLQVRSMRSKNEPLNDADDGTYRQSG